MNRELLHKLIEAIVAEVVRRVAILERRKQHPERVLVLLAAPLAYPKELKELLKAQFGEGYTPVSFTERNDLEDENTLFLSKLGEAGLMEKVTAAKTVILVGPRLELLGKIARGEDQEFLSYLMVRSILWKKDVRLYLDFDPPQFRRNTFLEGVASGIDTLRQMQVTVCPYFKGEAAAAKQSSLITEADVLAAAEEKEKTIHAQVGAIITPAARDALLTSGVIVQYEGETICN
ncbi:MAG: hypothetical protein IKT58_07115 [Oscillospiraceae bacterium]|nr:hypothetical protein [Oscillospiraceae bacterium]